MRRLLFSLLLLLLCFPLSAQEPSTGGIKGKIVSRNGRYPVENARITILQKATPMGETCSDAKGSFQLDNLPDGYYTLVVEAPEYLENRMKVMVSDGRMKNLFNVPLSAVNHVADETPEALFASADIYQNLMRTQFPTLRGYIRGMGPESRTYYLAGVRLDEEDPLPATLWQGLGESMRETTSLEGPALSGLGFGGYNGSTFIEGTASSFRRGFRSNLLTHSQLYFLQAQASGSTGTLSGGWTLAADISARLGMRESFSGRPVSAYIGADKAFSPATRVSAAFFYAQSPVSFLRFSYTPSPRFQTYVTALGIFGPSGSVHMASAFLWRPEARVSLQGGVDGRMGLADPSFRRLEAWAGASWVIKRLEFTAGVRAGTVRTGEGSQKQYAGKAGIHYIYDNMRIYGNMGYFHEADSRLVSSDLNWSFNSNGVNFRVTTFVFSDLPVDNFRVGGEVGFKVPVFLIPNLSVQGLASMGLFGDKSLLPPLMISAGLSWSSNAWFVDADFQDVDSRFFINLSSGKSWMLGGKHLFGVSASVRNILNNRKASDLLSYALPGFHYLLKLFYKI